jgi:hypothetical protein
MHMIGKKYQRRENMCVFFFLLQLSIKPEKGEIVHVKS